jgi:hypothetical protein
MTASKVMGWALLVDLAILIALCADVYLSYQNYKLMRGVY